MRVALPFRFGACMGALMATKRTRRGAAKSAPRVPEGDSQTTPGTPAETSAPDGNKSDAELIDVARKSLMEAVPETATALADGAKEGSVPHIKLLLQLVGLDEAGFAPIVVRPKEKTLEELVMEQWYREP
jgi:hypothetical protein